MVAWWRLQVVPIAMAATPPPAPRMAAMAAESRRQMNEISHKPAQTVSELASARQHVSAPETWPTIMKRTVEGG